MQWYPERSFLHYSLQLLPSHLALVFVLEDSASRDGLSKGSGDGWRIRGDYEGYILQARRSKAMEEGALHYQHFEETRDHQGYAVGFVRHNLDFVGRLRLEVTCG